MRILYRCQTWPVPEEAACAALVSVAVALRARMSRTDLRTGVPHAHNLRRVLRCLMGGRAGIAFVAALEYEWLNLLEGTLL